MKIFDRFNTALLVSAGLCGAALAFSPGAAAAPLPTGGPTCVEQMSGLAGAAAAPAALPAVLPGPPPAVIPPPLLPPGVPLLPPGVPALPPGVPALPPVLPPGAPLIGPLAAGAPLAVDPPVMGAGILAGKGVPTAPSPAVLSGFVVLPGPPASVQAPAPAAPVVAPAPAGTAAAESLPCCDAGPSVR